MIVVNNDYMRFFLFLICSSFFFTTRAGVITVQEKVSPGAWLCFRKDINIVDVDDIKSLKIAADSKYWLWINGEMVVREGGVKRGPNPKDTYCDVLTDIEWFKKGKNTIAILVWYFGKDGFSHRNSPTAGVYFDLHIGKKHIQSDSTWRALLHPAFYVPKGQKPNYRLSESNIGYDSEQEISFYQEKFDDSLWKNAYSLSLEEAGWGKLVARPIPMWKDFGLRDYSNVKKQGDTLIFADLPYNSQITPYIKLKAPANLKIDIRTDNYRGGGAPNVFAEYVTKEGVQEFEAWGWMNGHQVCYTIPKGVEVLDVKFRETGYATEFAGSFSCEEQFYNKLWDKSLRTLYITMRDTYMDCPDRERAQWWGDVVNELGEAFYSLDQNAHLLTRKAILELMNWQRPDSTIFAPVPAGNWNQELPMQMLASVGYYGFWTYYMGTGDTNTIKAVYPNVKKYIHVWKLDEEGLVVPRKGGWTWGDWGDNKDLVLLYNLWYSLALEGFHLMADLLGEKEDSRWACQVNERLKRAFHTKYWNGTFYLSPHYKGKPDDRAQALAVVAGVLPESDYSVIRPFFKQQYHASPYMEKYVLEALCMMGYYEDALERMKKRYYDMVESDLTTLWEGWGIGSKGFGGGSYNHAWSGGPLTILSQYFAGISPLKPAFKEFIIKPVWNCFGHIQSVTPTQWGKIEISIMNKLNVIVVEVKIPRSTKGHFVIPDKIKKYRINGKEKKTGKQEIVLKEGVWEIELY